MNCTVLSLYDSRITEFTLSLVLQGNEIIPVLAVERSQNS
jgi:hypothetical protein